MAFIRGRRLLFQRGVTVLILLVGSFASSHGAGGGYCGRAGSIRKGIAAAAHDAKREILFTQ